MQPARVCSCSLSASSASAIAWPAATIANSEKRSSSLTSLRERKRVASQSFTSHAKRVSNALASKRVIGAAPLAPSSIARQVACAS